MKWGSASLQVLQLQSQPFTGSVSACLRQSSAATTNTDAVLRLLVPVHPVQNDRGGGGLFVSDLRLSGCFRLFWPSNAAEFCAAYFVLSAAFQPEPPPTIQVEWPQLPHTWEPVTTTSGEKRAPTGRNNRRERR